MIAETFHAWAAGIVDGEGCISIKRSARGYYQVSVTVGQSGKRIPKMLTALKKAYGGSFCRSGQWTDLDRRRNRMPKRNWQVVGRDAHSMLLKIYPYLIQKQNQARIAVEFRNFVGLPGSHVKPEDRSGQMLLFRKLAELKNYRRAA
jgi:hypothetical protein